MLEDVNKLGYIKVNNLIIGAWYDLFDDFLFRALVKIRIVCSEVSLHVVTEIVKGDAEGNNGHIDKYTVPKAS